MSYTGFKMSLMHDVKTFFFSYDVSFFFYILFYQTFEPPRFKTNKMSVRPAKSQISLGRSTKDPRFLHTNSKDSD